MTQPIPFGDNELFGLGELLQMARLRRHSGSLMLRGSQGAARLHFLGGSFAAASWGEVQAILTDVLQWRQGTAVLQRASTPAVPFLLFDVEMQLVQAVCALDELRVTPSAVCGLASSDAVAPATADEHRVRLGMVAGGGMPAAPKPGGRLRRWLARRPWAIGRGDSQFRVPVAPPCPLDA